MNYLSNPIFRFLKPNFSKLAAFGFTDSDGIYRYQTQIADGQMSLYVAIGETIETHVYDLDTGDEYTLHTVEDASGEFVGKVRADYCAVLQEIADRCFETQVFKTAQFEQALKFAESEFGDLPEFLWDGLPDCCVLRRKDNQKWYAVFMTLDGSKLQIGEGRIEIIDVRCDSEELDKLVDGERYFRGWHMNKKHWLTLVLDGKTDTEELLRRLRESYDLAKKK